jgi:hypothetical protein
MPITINDCRECGNAPGIVNWSVAEDYDYSSDFIEIYCKSEECNRVIQDGEVLVAIKKWNEANGGKDADTPDNQ